MGSVKEKFYLHDSVVDHWAKKIGPGAFMLLCFYYRKANDKSQSWYPIPRIADILGCSDRSIQTYNETLESHGLIAIGRKHRNVHLITIRPQQILRGSSDQTAEFSDNNENFSDEASNNCRPSTTQEVDTRSTINEENFDYTNPPPVTDEDRNAAARGIDEMRRQLSGKFGMK